jgi:hypothetical protein
MGEKSEVGPIGVFMTRAYRIHPAFKLHRYGITVPTTASIERATHGIKGYSRQTKLCTFSVVDRMANLIHQSIPRPQHGFDDVKIS